MGKAKRGELFSYSITHSYTSLVDGTVCSKSYVIGYVSGITRQGIIARYIEARTGNEYKQFPRNPMLVNNDRFDLAACWDAYRANPREFPSIDDVREFFLKFLRKLP